MAARNHARSPGGRFPLCRDGTSVLPDMLTTGWLMNDFEPTTCKSCKKLVGERVELVHLVNVCFVCGQPLTKPQRETAGSKWICKKCRK